MDPEKDQVEDDQKTESEGAKASDDSDFELEIVDDTPEEDRGRPRRPEGAEPEIPEDDEIANYSDSVQKRIKKLKFEFHEERRRAEEAQRLRDEAISYAERAAKEAERYRNMVSEGEGVLYQQAESRIDAQLAAAKQAYKEAYESGDSDKLLDASEKLTALQNEKYRVSTYKQQQAQRRAMAQRQAEYQAQQPQQPQQPQVPKPSPAAQEWAEKNPWFNSDKMMTAYAFGVHEDLVTNGVQPDTEEYYRQIDENMRKRFPEKFEAEENGETQPRKVRS